MQPHPASLIAHTEANTDAALPRFIRDDFDALLECCILAHGFWRLRSRSPDVTAGRRRRRQVLDAVRAGAQTAFPRRLAVAMNGAAPASDSASITGHPFSGHVDGLGRIVQVRRPENNHVLRIELPPALRRYVFAKGCIAVNGCSLTAADVHRGEGWFEVWLIPETLRMTTFGAKREGDALDIEIERQTQVFVDTVREAIDERLGPLVPALEALLRERGGGDRGVGEAIAGAAEGVSPGCEERT